MWRKTDTEGCESLKIRWEIVPYTRGSVLDLGCGSESPFKHFVGVDNMHHQKEGMIKVNASVIVETCERLNKFGSQSWDAVFSSHLLEHIEDYKGALKEWWRIVKKGGYLVLYLPHKNFYPNMGDSGANPDHKHDFLPEDIISAMREIGGWDLVENQERNANTEYSFLQVYQKRNDKQCVIVPPVKGKKAAAVRYGAWGDMMQTSSVLPHLKEQGYHVTLYTNERGAEVLKHDPNVDRFIVQDTDQVPNEALSSFFLYTSLKYDKFINLSESVEGTLLAIPGRANHEWPHAFRHKRLNVNYLEFMHDLADVPRDPRVKFYPSAEEKQWAAKQREKLGKPVILWSLAGSAVHKAYPHAHQVMARILYAYPEATIVTVGDDSCKIQEFAWEKEPRILRRSGEWTIRQSLTFCEYADLIVGTETGVLNAAAMLKVPKIVFLSHSSPENLTKGWVNTASMEPELTPCYPCHRMHYGWDYCNKEKDSHAALCQFNISVPRVWKRVVEFLGEPMVAVPEEDEAPIVLHDNKALLRDNVAAAFA